MWKRSLTLSCLILFSILLSGCAGGTSGSVRNASQSCLTKGGSGNCEGRLGRLSGTSGIDIKDEGISPTDAILVEINVSVETGTLNVFFEGPDGDTTIMEVGPGNPLRLSGLIQGEFDGFGIGFQASSEFVEGVTYSLYYAIQ